MSEICSEVEDQLGLTLRSRHEAGPVRRLLDRGDLVRYAVLEGGDYQTGSGSLARTQ